MKYPVLTALLFSAVAVSACNMTQAPAQVEKKGSNFYGTQAEKSVQMAHYTPHSASVPRPARTPMEPAVPVMHVAPSQQQRPSYEHQPSSSTAAVHKGVDLAQVTVKDLEPLTVSEVAPLEPPMESQTAAYNEEPSDLPLQSEPLLNTTEVLPEPQARVVSDSATIPEAAPTPVAATGKGFIWPVKGKVISNFGETVDGERNDGINIAAQEGEPIVAAADGEVVYSGNELRGYGNMVIVRHDNGLMTAYAHADRILVSKGERVRQGVTIATVGKSGGVDQAQVHFGVRKNKEPIDPMTVLSQNNFASR